MASRMTVGAMSIHARRLWCGSIDARSGPSWRGMVSALAATGPVWVDMVSLLTQHHECVPRRVWVATPCSRSPPTPLLLPLAQDPPEVADSMAEDMSARAVSTSTSPLSAAYALSWMALVTAG